MIRSLVVLGSTTAMLALAACGEEAAGPVAAVPAPSAERFCALGRQLDAAGEKVFGRLGQDATAQQYEDAEREFVERFQDDLGALEAAAPDAIEADVRTLLAAQRKRGGLDATVDVSRREAGAAEKRVLAYERRACRR